MKLRIRHCVECPGCQTRYLIASSPYANGSWLIPNIQSSPDEYTLYCSCGQPSVASRWQADKLKICKVNGDAYSRGFGAPDEIVTISDLAMDAEGFSRNFGTS